VQRPRPPIIIGGYGPRRSPALAARYADEYNVPFAPVDAFVAQRDTVIAACRSADRDPSSMRFSVAVVVCCGESDEQVELRAGVIGRAADDLRANAVAGTPSEVLDTIATYAEAGADRCYLQVLDFDDVDHVHLLGERVLPLLP
jgi:alkanesulfonate monooxygenase SsuD/methylene tetrahydromethanopterin reductase-like flavin-dependent oxidoreductase (luciferase family)